MILVDVDDIFVGEKGTRLKKDDVMALLATQQRIQALVPGFKFNLGFSGKYFHHGTAEENLGDDMLLENVDRYDVQILAVCESDQGEHGMCDPAAARVYRESIPRRFEREHAIAAESLIAAAFIIQIYYLAKRALRGRAARNELNVQFHRHLAHYNITSRDCSLQRRAV